MGEILGGIRDYWTENICFLKKKVAVRLERVECVSRGKGLRQPPLGRETPWNRRIKEYFLLEGMDEDH